MRWTTARHVSKIRRSAGVLAVMALFAAGWGSESAAFAAEGPTNTTPATAVTFTALPFTANAEAAFDLNTPASDASAQLVASECNGGQSIYGPVWWKFTPTSSATFVVHAADIVGSIAGYDPSGLAVVSADAASVVECGVPLTGIQGTGALTVPAGSSLYIVAFQAQPGDTFYAPGIGVYPSSGVPPLNDEPSTATVISTLPYTVTQDTTLATMNFGGVGCFSKYGRGPDVWFKWVADRSDLVDFRAVADYDVHTAIAPLIDGVPGMATCDEVVPAAVGTTYLVAVWSTAGDLKQSGTMTLTADYLPPKPSLSAAIDPSGVVAKKTGIVTVSGAVSCSGSSGTPSTSGTVRQVYKRQVQTAPLTFAGLASCTSSGRWTAKGSSSTFLFTGGTADVSVTVEACNQRGCTTVTTTRAVKLKVM